MINLESNEHDIEAAAKELAHLAGEIEFAEASGFSFSPARDRAVQLQEDWRTKLAPTDDELAEHSI